MPHAVETEISPAGRIVGTVTLCTVGGLTRDDHRSVDRSLLIEGYERKTGAVRGSVVIGVAVAIAGIIGIVVAVVGRVIAVSIATGCDRRTRRDACADGKCCIPAIAATAIAAELAASHDASVALRELPIAAGSKIRVATSNICLSAHVRLHALAAAHPGAAHISACRVRAATRPATM